MAKTKKQRLKEEIKLELIGIILIAIAIYLFWVIFQKPSGPYPLPEESKGWLGEFLFRVLKGLTGEGKLLIPLLLLFNGAKILFRRPFPDLPRIYLVQVIFLLSILSILHLNLPPEEQTIFNGLQYGLGGGFLGGCISWLTTKVFGIIGSYILLFSLNIASILYLSRISLKDVILKIWALILKFFRGLKKQIADFIFTTVE
ncbi:MAG: hypothetical protein GXW85_03175 [Clostridia bacterium]|nr:hypothetical protein [Clostridia bacterium]